MFSSNTTQTSGGYQISRSLRFNRADSAYLNRTPASDGNRTAWTYSFWIKRSGLSTEQHFIGSSGIQYYFSTGNALVIVESGSTSLITTQVFRDTSAWYHIVIVWDSANSTSGDRARLYVNGSRVTAFDTATYPAQNTQSGFNQAIISYIGRYAGGGVYYFDGYQTETNFIDGQALTPSSFGETNAQTGVWQPKAYSGSYGTNGFYLNFSDNSNTTAATLGKDYSGNGNNWTPNNFSVTAGAGNDSLVDSPTSYGTDTGVGGTVRGNYGTLNPLFNATTLTNGNLDASLTTASTTGTFGASSSKWYFECTVNSKTDLSATDYLGIANETLVKSDSSFSYSQVYVYLSNAQKGGNGGSGSYGASWTVGDVIGVAYDLDAGSITFYKNGTSQGVAYSTGFTVGSSWRPFLYASGGTNTFTFNFGQRPFAYTAPSGYKALCTQNLPTPTIGATTATQAGKYFNTVLYTGTDSAQTITGVGFQPDYVWLKNRTAANAPKNLDVLRGAGWSLSSAETGAEANQTNAFTAFTSDGFSVATNGGEYNASGKNYVAWNWKANGSGSTNTAGTITSTVSANTTSGFSVVTYAGNSTLGATVGHGLGVAPSMIIVKSRSAATNWPVYHTSIGNTKALFLNLTNATDTDNYWNNTSPTSTVFSLNASTGLNSSGSNYVAYCFAEVAGYSKFGSYTGNGSSDGTFVYTGFRPAYVLIKRTTSAYNWWILDAARGTINAVKGRLYADASDAESTTYPYVDFLSNGFKLRDADGGNNASGEPYIYACFASAPFKYSLAR